MNRRRWKIAEHAEPCRRCSDVILPGDLHVARVCLECTVPMTLRQVLQTSWEPPDNWMNLYYANLTRVVRLSRGLK